MKKKIIFASDFDKTLSIGDVGCILSGKLGISAEQFNRKIEDIKRRNIVQLGGELAHLIVRDPDYIGKVTKDLLYEVGREVELKKGVRDLMKILAEGIDNYRFSAYIVSAAPKECVEKAVEGILPVDNVYGTTFIYKNDIVQDIERTNAGHAKVATLDMLKEKENVPRDAIIYVGDGSSDVHVMLHIMSYNGYPRVLRKNLIRPFMTTKATKTATTTPMNMNIKALKKSSVGAPPVWLKINKSDRNTGTTKPFLFHQIAAIIIGT